MRKKDEFTIDVVSGIDDDIVTKNLQKRFELWFSRGKKPKRNKWIPIIAAAACFCIIITALFIFGPFEKQVPIYQGMTVSNTPIDSQSASVYTVPEYSMDMLSYSMPEFENPWMLSAGNNGQGNAYGHNKHNQNDAEIVDAVESSLKIVGGEKDIYYAEKNTDIYITIHIDNPDKYEILSFTLNGEKYSSYMFEDGSDLENLILKVKIGDVEGILDYTIDAIKYVDGTDIKDVRMEGDRTVKVGIASYKQPVAVIADEKVAFNDISFNLSVKDELGLIERSEGRVDVTLFDGEAVLVTKSVSDLADGEKIKIDGLKAGVEYMYVISATYDALDGTGKNTYILAKKIFTTLSGFMFDDVTVGQESIAYTPAWSEDYENHELVSLTLLLDEEKVRELSIDTISINGLLSGRTYTLVAQYKNKNKNQIDTAYLNFTTERKTAPIVAIDASAKTQTSISFGVTVTDPDGINVITKVELLHGDDAPVVADNVNLREFAGLLSNNMYTVQVTYTYDLNDGEGAHTETKTLDIQTERKTAPIVAIDASAKTQTSISFGVTVTDPDEINSITKVELLHGDDEPVVLEHLDAIEVAGLTPYTKYTLKISYEYDLNDGNGIQYASAEHTEYTQPYFNITGCTVLGTSNGAAVQGDLLIFRIQMDNPAGLIAKEVTINGKVYGVNTVFTDANVVAVNISVNEDFQGGENTLTVESIRFDGELETIIYEPNSNNSAKVFINGIMEIVDVNAVDKDGNILKVIYPSTEVYVLISLNNETGYSVSDVIISASGYIEDSIPFELVEQTSEYVKLRFEGQFTYYNFYVYSITYGNEYIASRTEEFKDKIALAQRYTILESDEIVEVRTVEDLQNMSEQRHYKLMNDIDLSGLTNVQNFGNFNGFFDGNGHTISGYTFLQRGSGSEDDLRLGLFSEVNHGVVKDLNISNVMVSVSQWHASVTYGGFAVSVAHVLDFENVTISGGVYLDVMEQKEPGIWAYCYAGGLVGCGDTKIAFYNCVNNLDITAVCSYNGSTNSLSSVGGFVAGWSSADVRFYNCYNNGDITASSRMVSGFIAGSGNNVEFIDCVNNGKINATVDEKGIASGFAAYYENDKLHISFENCINNSEVVGANQSAFLSCEDYYIGKFSQIGCTNNVNGLIDVDFDLVGR